MKYLICIAILFAASGCAAVQQALAAVGLVDAAGDPTTTGETVSAWVQALTGFSLVRLYDLAFTNRGWDNAKNMVSPDSGWWGTLKSLWAWVSGNHSPTEVVESRLDLDLSEE